MFTTAPLFGRFHSRLLHPPTPQPQDPFHHLECLLAHRLPPNRLAPNRSHANSRQRIYTPKLTFLAFLDHRLHPHQSCREAVRQIRAYYQKEPQPVLLDQETSAYCQARARWSLEKLVQIRRDLNPIAPYDCLHLPCPRPVKVLDGTCLNLPDTPLNRQAYPQSTSQQPQCGFPLLRLVGLFALETGALLERAYGPYTTSQNALYQSLWPTLKAGDLIVGDRNFSSWGQLASLQAQNLDGLFRLNSNRNADFRQGRRLGPHERLVSWAKPRQCPAHWTPEQWQALPPTLTVRLVRLRVPTANGRCKKIILLTTLLDPILWPGELLAALYHRRWDIELRLDELKTTLHLDMLSCRSPAMIHKELEMHLIAYNLVRSLMNEAACLAYAPLERLSFKGTLDTARQYSHIIAQLPRSHRQRRRAMYLDMLAVIAADLVPERPDRFEPRCQKRRPKAYPFMTRPRHELRAARKDHLPACA